MIKVTRTSELETQAQQLEKDAQILRGNGYEREALSVEASAKDMRERAQQLRRGRPPGVRFG
jgi:hypothetical protein